MFKSPQVTSAAFKLADGLMLRSLLIVPGEADAFNFGKQNFVIIISRLM